MNPKDENKVMGPNKVSKNPWECKISKRAKETKGKQMSQGIPREKQKGHRSLEVRKEISGHTKPLRERINGWPKEAQQD